MRPFAVDDTLYYNSALAGNRIIMEFKVDYTATENFSIVNAKIGDNFKCGAFSVIGEEGTNEVEIGNDVVIGNFVIIKSGAKIGDCAIIHDRVTIKSYELVDDSEEVFFTREY